MTEPSNHDKHCIKFVDINLKHCDQDQNVPKIHVFDCLKGKKYSHVDEVVMQLLPPARF